MMSAPLSRLRCRSALGPSPSEPRERARWLRGGRRPKGEKLRKPKNGALRSRRGAHRCFSLNDAENVALFHDEQFLAVDLDLGARPFAEQDAVAFIDVERHQLAGLIARAGSNGENLA